MPEREKANLLHARPPCDAAEANWKILHLPNATSNAAFKLEKLWACPQTIRMGLGT
jgi:hypothetical protein